MNTVPDYLFDFIPDRRCTKCNAVKSLTDFETSSHHPSGFTRHCKACCRLRRDKWKAAHPGRQTELCREWARRNNPLRRERVNAIAAKTNKRRRPRINAWKRAYRAKPAMLIETRIRNLFAGAMRKFSNTGKLYPCRKYGIDFAAIVAHLGPCPGPRLEWHIDHIIPCVAFDHNDPSEITACWHPLNLRWAPAGENLRKQDKYDPRDKAELIRRIRGA